jgi:hypothetical protein
MRISDDPADKELSISSDMAARMPTPPLREFLKRPGISMLLLLAIFIVLQLMLLTLTAAVK